jgi:hypothetical protein
MCAAYKSIDERKKANSSHLHNTLSPDITFLSDGKLDTLALGQRYPWLGTLTNDEDVGNTEKYLAEIRCTAKMCVPGSESPVQRILDVDDIETSDVLLPVHNNTSPAHVASTGDHDNVAGIELDEIGDLVLLNVEFHGVISLDERIGIADGTAVVGDNVGDSSTSDSNTANFQEFVGGFLGGDTVNGEATFDIVKDTEVFAGLFDGNDI